MNKEEIKRRLNRRIDQDDTFASNISNALDANDESWLEELIAEVIGIVIQVVLSEILNWLRIQYGR
jgi:hypothetical protein